MTDLSGAVIAHPIGSQNCAIVTYRDNHLMVGSPQLRDTMTERSRPSDLLLAALVTDCTFACQESARELGVLLTSMHTTAQWERTNSDQSIRIRLALTGPDQQQAERLVCMIKSHSQTYNMLQAGVDIEFEIVL
ncbi:MAG: OsmC family protein [Anaerolineae bacterium]|nr:OsmC family protein [Anaerolineae bacterium]